MSKQNRKKPAQNTQNTTPTSKVKVLYQNLNGVWYAFAESDADVYFGRVPFNNKTQSAKKSQAKNSGRSRRPLAKAA